MRGLDVEEALGGPLLLEAPQEPMAAGISDHVWSVRKLLEV
jgi:hypothetical protein